MQRDGMRACREKRGSGGRRKRTSRGQQQNVATEKKRQWAYGRVAVEYVTEDELEILV